MASFFKGYSKRYNDMSKSQSTLLSLNHLVSGELFFLPLAAISNQEVIRKIIVSEKQEVDLSQKINNLIKKYWK